MSRSDDDQGVSAMPREHQTTRDVPTTEETAPAETAPTEATAAETTTEAASGAAPAERSPAWVRLWWTPLVLFAVVGLLAAGAGLRGLLDRPPADSSVDVGFARDMSEHHSQAVQMAMVEFSRGDDAVIRSVAQDIALGQQQEIGIMYTWLAGWGRPPTSARAPMAWMTDPNDPAGQGGGHAGHGEMPGVEGNSPTGGAAGGVAAEETAPVRMPGMASEAELARLAAASGRDLDVLFLTLMIRHHRGGVDMAQHASLHAADDRVRALARAMVVNQAKEINTMQADLERLGAPRA
ncbi:DUF305 domain-containing protein [Parafrankia elaeagni]|uniref:DUF305 domain-containing protein n=1 Tax=Parafrankia elaeagni TaxID=222534 RepID=UPI00037BBF4C|nr:DUF305 domain-containing protein [Parafrankia elaeagni]